MFVPYKRLRLLKRLLEELRGQETGGLFTYSIVVVDNDQSRSAQTVVGEFAASSIIPIKYCTEPRQNIAMARNTAVENAHGDLIAFIDDDEFPIKRWLLTLFEALNKYGADGVLGPVKPHFEDEPPQWVVKGKFYERASYPTGFVIDWRKGRTGNVLLKRSLFSDARNDSTRSFGREKIRTSSEDKSKKDTCSSGAMRPWRMKLCHLRAGIVRL